MPKSSQCLCGHVYGEPENRVICGYHFDVVEDERNRLLIEVQELRAEVQRLSQIAKY